MPASTARETAQNVGAMAADRSNGGAWRVAEPASSRSACRSESSSAMFFDSAS